MEIEEKYRKQVNEGTQRIFAALQNDIVITEDTVENCVGLIYGIRSLLRRNESIEFISTSTNISVNTIMVIKEHYDELDRMSPELKSYAMRKGGN